MLWNVAKDKLYELGRLCGLVPGATVGSQQLHAVATLSTGVVDSHDEDDGQELRRPTPVDKLKEALSSQTAFTKHYLVRPRLENRFFFQICAALFQVFDWFDSAKLYPVSLDFTWI